MPISIRDDYPPGAARGGACYICSAGRREVRFDGPLRTEKVIDLEQMIDFEGYLCVCETCVREAAELLGLVSPAEVDAMAERLAVAEVECQTARAERDEAHQLVDLIRGYDEKHAGAELTPEELIAKRRALEPTPEDLVAAIAAPARRSRAKTSA